MPPVFIDTAHQEFRVFVRKARQAVHQALYFLYELEFIERLPAHDSLKLKLAADVTFARGQVTVILDSARIPDVSPGTPQVPPAASMRRGLRAFFVNRNPNPPELFALAQDLGSDNPEVQKAAEAKTILFWDQRVRGLLRASERPSTWTATEMIDQLRAFLQVTHPRGFDRVNRFVDKVWIMVRRNLSFLLGLAAAVTAFVSVEQLRSLLVNNPRGYLALAVVAGGGLIVEVLRYSPVKLLELAARLRIPILEGPIKRLLHERSGALNLLSVRIRIGKRAFYQWGSHSSTPERGIERWPVASEMREVIGNWEIMRTIALAVFLYVAYNVGIRVSHQSAETYRTLFPIAALFLLGLIALHWVDLWDFIDWRPIRILGLGLFLAFLVGALLLDAYLLFAVGVPLCLLAVWLHQAILRRRVTWAGILSALLCMAIIVSAGWGWKTKERGVWRASPSDAISFNRITAAEFPFGGETGPPVVLVAASGGGSRAAVYTALALDAIQNDQGNSSEFREIGQNLHAISSVSGGSLAAAAYIAEKIRRHELQTRHHPEQSAWNTSAYVRQNFLNPTLEGAVRPGTNRGQAIEEFWDTRVHLDGRTLRELAELWRAEAHQQAQGQAHGPTGTADETASRETKGQPPFPLPLFNSCALDSHAVVISPLAFRAYSADDHDKRAQRLHDLKDAYGFRTLDQLTWVVDRDAIYGLDEWNDKVNPTMAQAVRASANFPFGFPLVDVETSQEYGTPFQKDSRRVLLTDGGVLSNSGLWTLYHLMTTDATILRKLKTRGVLLIVIDVSKMPQYKARGDFTSLFGAIRDQAPISQNLHRKMFELLAQHFGPRLRIVGIDLPPTVYDNVQTTWALDDRSLKRLDCNFTALWTGTTATHDDACMKIRGGPQPPDKGDVLKAAFRDRLLKAWRGLKASTPPSPDEASLLRVPLD